MRSSFMGLETSKRGMFTHQSALYTTGHNISNANTLGYSRQRVNMESTSGYPGVGLNSGTMPGFLGTGVQAGSIQRVRDSFVDQQYRQEANKFGYWESQTKAISQMEDVLAEPSAYGLQKSMSEFWQSLQDLAVNPKDGGARSVVIRRGEAVADSFNYIHKSLKDIQTNLGKEIDVTTGEVNSILQQISELNEQITNVEPNGYLPNDLYDARDVLIDQLSSILPIETSYEKSGGRALAIAEGTVTITLKMKNGDKIELVNRNRFATLGTDPNPLVAVDGSNNPISGLTIQSSDGTKYTPEHVDFLDHGQLKSLMNSYGYDTQTVDANGDKIIKGLYPDMIAELNKMAKAFVKEFNAIHELGYGLPPNDAANGTPFFDPAGLEAGSIKVNSDIIDDPTKLGASGAPGEEGNSEIAKKLADLQFGAMNDLDGATIQDYYKGVIGKLGVDGRQAENNTLNSATLLGAVEHRRASISSVSLDEEMTDMIRFQQAYNASARMITVVDETLDKIINGMGVVGR
ncbi:flagellar hook-associated protein FlgK [Sporosarcina sp. FSL K6-1522]|uniref:flagellar hook-associated protein FlgK n=1 Tax=Sporosarcina sp. FSL K6-1522 TaxID=2921554 RepID=UPI00315A0A34